MSQTPQSDTLLRADSRTAFVLGNGPSLADVSLPSLSDYATIGLNAAYRYWREIDWRPRYYACVDTVVGLSHKDEIATLVEEGRIEKFLLRNNLIEALGPVAQTNRVVNFDVLHEQSPLLSVKPPTTGSHAALWAGDMGYRQVVMLGIDLQYTEFVEGSAKRDGIELEIVEQRDNPNYFFKGYQAPGDRYNIPNPRPDLHVNAWRGAIAHLEDAGVSVLNGNPQSAVRCAPVIALDQFLTDGDEFRPRAEPLQSIEEEDHSLSSAPAPAETATHRLKRFLRHYALPIIAAAGIAGAALVAWITTMQPHATTTWLTIGATGVMLSAGIVFLYVRHTIVQHLQRLDREVSALRARTADLERKH